MLIIRISIQETKSFPVFIFSSLQLKLYFLCNPEH